MAWNVALHYRKELELLHVHYRRLLRDAHHERPGDWTTVDHYQRNLSLALDTIHDMQAETGFSLPSKGPWGSNTSW